jgi:hypothetical protein
VLLPKPALQKLAKALYFTPRSVIISFAYFTTLTTLSLHCTSAILHQPLISSDPISSQPTKHHHITGAKDHVQVTHTKGLDCSTHSKLNCSTSKLKGLQLKDVTRIYTKPQYRSSDHTSGKSLHLINSKKIFKFNFLENLNSQYSLLYCKVYTCSRVITQSSQNLQLHHSSQVNYNNYSRDKYPYLHESITLKSKKLKITISNSFFPLWLCIACVCKSVCTGSAMTTRNSGASRLLFKKTDQMEVDLAASSSMERSDRMELYTPTTNLKRLIAEKAVLKENKKTKSQALLEISVPAKVPHTKYWLGFSTMEQLAMDNGIEELFNDESVADKATRGIPQQETEEMMYAQVAYPRIPQQLYPKTRSDNILGQHYNITQIPFDIATNPDTGLSLDYHVAIHFKPPRTPILYDVVKAMVLKRCTDMEIPLGQDLIDPVTILCKHDKEGEQKGVWSGIIKLHLLRPEVDGINLLRGLRPFILRLDDD